MRGNRQVVKQVLWPAVLVLDLSLLRPEVGSPSVLVGFQLAGLKLKSEQPPCIHLRYSLPLRRGRGSMRPHILPMIMQGPDGFRPDSSAMIVMEMEALHRQKSSAEPWSPPPNARKLLQAALPTCKFIEWHFIKGSGSLAVLPLPIDRHGSSCAERGDALRSQESPITSGGAAIVNKPEGTHRGCHMLMLHVQLGLECS